MNTNTMELNLDEMEMVNGGSLLRIIKGITYGAVGGAAVGGCAGGPAGCVIGAVCGGIAGGFSIPPVSSRRT